MPSQVRDKANINDCLQHAYMIDITFGNGPGCDGRRGRIHNIHGIRNDEIRR